MPGFHPVELIIILVVALLIFGPKKLPEMGSAIGKSIKEFQKGMKELTTGKDDEDDFKHSAKASLEAIEREIAARKAAASAAEAAQPEIVVDAKEPEAQQTHEAHEAKVD